MQICFNSSKPNALQESVSTNIFLLIIFCIYLHDLSSLSCSAFRLFQQEKHTLSIHCNELLVEAEATAEDDSLPKEAQISIIRDPDELHNFAAYAT